MDSGLLAAALDDHDRLLRDVAEGCLSLAEFVEKYDNFYWKYALDGHEPEPSADQLRALASRIEPHRRVAAEVLAMLAAESDAHQPMYRAAGRIGAAEALARLRLIKETLPPAGSNNAFNRTPLRGAG